MTRYTQFKSIVIQSSVSTFYCQAITVYSRILVKLAQVLLRRSSWHVLSFPFAVPVRLERSWCISNSVANSNAYMRTAIVQLWHCPIYIPLLVSSCKSFSKMERESREGRVWSTTRGPWICFDRSSIEASKKRLDYRPYSLFHRNDNFRLEKNIFVL